jgi:beta-galactosidase
LKEEERTSRQLRGAGEKALLQQAFNYQEAANSNRKGFSTIGDANWLMFDYNRGYADDLEASGVSDFFRIPKFAYYFYESQRPPQEELKAPLQSGPMVYIASYWTENSSNDIRVFSNCEEVELLLNGKSIEKMKAVRDEYSSQLAYPPFVFDVEDFEPGTLSAKGYIDGKEVAVHEVSTPGKASQIILEADLSGIPISKNTADVIFVYARICDENGTTIPDATNLVQFTIEGEGELIGENPVKAEAGIATILLKTELFTSPIVIEATSEGLKEGELNLRGN